MSVKSAWVTSTKLSTEERALVEAAAAVERLTVSAFVRRVLPSAARDVLLRRRVAESGKPAV
jgi:uncharacterized protein (DUF1778 family)